MERTVLIPARGGSQRIPRKNIKEFLGVPALVRVIRTVQESGTADRVVVSTDDEEISAVARSAGAEVPFMRPAQLADAYTGARPVIQHAVRALGLHSNVRLGVVYPTALLTTAQDLRDSLRLLTGDDYDFVLSVAEFAAPIERALDVDAQRLVTPRDPERIQARTQDLVSTYHDVGQFYWGRARSWLTDVPVVQARCRAVILDSWRAVDIDTPDDWRRAELVFRMLNGDQ